LNFAYRQSSTVFAAKPGDQEHNRIKQFDGGAGHFLTFAVSGLSIMVSRRNRIWFHSVGENGQFEFTLKSEKGLYLFHFSIFSFKFILLMSFKIGNKTDK
jgi:hypothetical protein